ncbi:MULTISPECIES: DUF4280 domain-containing protein [Paenibacillus]|uniref:DUF4280 domain-containing protein n=1 Tax=Paenibacillus borealis TaxID=160799 RepID=A0ABX3H1G0_PAEBO|nr:DUF4280 domain-containing protein [Paenibacillus borealis]OMD42359.1 hypothetical protein BSK56_26065 [Paenibacillus borealis]
MLLPMLLSALVQGALKGEQSFVVRGAVLKCSMGTDPGVLNTMFSHGVYIKSKPILNIDDAVSGVNISKVNAFGFCKLKAAPCEPVITLASKWTGGKEDVLIDGAPALLSDSRLVCSCPGLDSLAIGAQVPPLPSVGGGGIISITDDGQDL